MMQQLNVNLTVPIPEDLVLVKKVELEELKEKSLIGLYWSMRDLEVRTGKKVDWLKENILYPSEFKRVLDVKNGGCVFYPSKQGEKWTFQASEMSKFLDVNFYKIFGTR